MAAGAIRFRCALGDDPFKAQPARLIEECAAVARDMLLVADAAPLTSADQRLQPCFAFGKRQRMQAFTVASEQVEDEVGERSSCRAAREGVLQHLKAGSPVRQD